jgi:peptidylprolyl isomerase
VRLRLPSALVLLAVPALLVAGCGSGKTEPSSGGTELGAVTVTGKAGAKPTVEVPAPFRLQATSTRILTAGTGAKVTAGQKVTVDYVLVNGRDGKEVETTFGKQPSTFTADEASLIRGLVKGMTGQPVGSRVLVGIPPADAFGATGNSQLGIGKDDTLVFVLDIRSARNSLTTATGTPVTPAKGLPTVSADGKTIVVPKTKAPAKLVVQPLIKGKGPVVQAGQTISAHYAGVVWDTGREFDSSYKTGRPADFPIGIGRVVKGWDQGLVGQTVGSRVLLVIPPAFGYGAKGDPRAGIKGTDTLVFAVDILDAA